MSLLPIVRALGGDLYDRGRRANVPAPGHSRRDRSVSLLLSGGRVVAHSFGQIGWREILDDLRRRGLVDAAGAPCTGATPTFEPAPAPLRAERLAAARRLWADGVAPGAGTLSARHAAMRAVRRVLPDALRHHAAAPLAAYRPCRATRPALLAGVHAADGELTAVEVTYLSPDGRRASGVRLPRKTVGLLPPGSAVRLDSAEPELLVGEGVFTTLSATERFGLPGWALLSTGNLRGWRPPEGVRRVLIAADRGRDGEASAAELARRLAGSGVRAQVRTPPAPVGDWNDAAQQAARNADGVREASRRWEEEEGTGRARRARRMVLCSRRGREPMTDFTTPAAAKRPERDRRTVPLRNLDVAPENLRAGEHADEDVPQLAATILAAGVLQPLTVRPGKRKEKPWMALDGRRRLLAMRMLLDAGDIDDGFGVDVFVETEPARQAAAVVLTNTGVPVHVADVIVAIGRMLKSKLTPAGIAAALGYAEIEIRRLAALSGLHSTALEALKAGKITLKQARQLARLPDSKEQAVLAKEALQGFGLPEWKLSGRLEDGRVTTLDRRFALIGAERYAAAGGRTETDLFGELPDRLLDPDVLDRLWAERARCLFEATGEPEVAVHVSSERRLEPPDGLEPLGWYGGDLTAEQLAAHEAARKELGELAGALRGTDIADDVAAPQLEAMLRAALACERAGQPGRAIRAVLLTPGGPMGVDARFFAEPATEEADEAPGDDELPNPAPGRATTRSGQDVVVPRLEVEVEGVSHILHETRTDMATRGLIRAVADDPGAALAALLARLFTVLVLEAACDTGQSALALTARGYRRARQDPVEALDGEVRRRFAERRAAYKASGLRPIPWIAALAHGEKMALMAELVALSLDLREERTDALRSAARADAADIAGLAAADIAAYWTPDERFLQSHGKKALLSMLEAMGVDDPRAKALKKDELVGFVAERAAERGWAPSELNWTGPGRDPAAVEGSAPPDGEHTADSDEATSTPAAPDDGVFAEAA